MRISTNTIAITTTMGNKKIIYRKDIISGNLFPRNEMIRLVKKGNEIVIDTSCSLSGRGVYIRCEAGNVPKIKNGKLLNKAFHQTVDPSLIERLLREVIHER